MAASPESEQVLQNLLNEPCIDSVHEDEFWNRVTRRGTASSAKEAWTAAQRSVWEDPSLNRKRVEVPPDRFKRLARIALPSKLPDMFPTLDTAASGLSAGALDSADSALVDDLIDEARLSSELRLSYLVWVAEHSSDFDAAKSSPIDLSDRLGLRAHHDHLGSGNPCVEIQFDRADLPPGVTLHVPSSLDGIDNECFRPTTDCAAPCGRTEPLNPAAGAGFPEAVHGACTVTRFDLTLLIP